MTIDFISASSYGAQTHSSGVVNIKKDLEQSIEGENVIVVEDIVDSGNTILLKLLFALLSDSLNYLPEKTVIINIY